MTRNNILIGLSGLGVVILGILFFFDAISLPFDSKVYCNQSASTTDCSKPPPDQFVTSSKLEPTTSLNPIQSGKMDEHLTIDNTLRDVNFCGKIYRVKQVLVDEVDVVQRIAELTMNSNPLTEDICINIELNNSNTSQNKIELTVGEVKRFPGSDVDQKGDMYAFNISVVRFNVNTSSGEIYYNNDYDGSLVGPIGKLK